MTAQKEVTTFQDQSTVHGHSHSQTAAYGGETTSYGKRSMFGSKNPSVVDNQNQGYTQRTVYGPKTSYVVTERVPVTTTETVTQTCTKCGSSYCPKPQCCGIVSKSVLARATAQGGTGEPQIGLIPTMKILAP